MSKILAAFMVPNSPYIIPEVGKNLAYNFSDLISAYEDIGESIARLQPETIIFVSSQATMYSDYFHISPGNAAMGSLAEFDAVEIKHLEEYNIQLVNEISSIARTHRFPAGIMGEKDRFIDFGTMVPLHFIRRHYRGGKIVKMGLSELSVQDHYRMGQILQLAVDRLGTKTIVVASANLSYRLEGSPYGFVAEAPVYNYKIMDICTRGAFDELLSMDYDFCKRAGEGGHKAFLVMAGSMDGLNVNVMRHATSAYAGAGYGICAYLTGGVNYNRRFLSV
ncbi:MAG: hypothetical protein IJR29_01165 [Butyrivibrio sp.]|nr:hypothetical protein [Butyrivibrio sp.]